MFGDQENAVDGQSARAEREGVSNRRALADPVPACLGSAQIGLRRGLFDEQAGDLERRLVEPMAVVHREPIDKSADDVVSMRQVMIDRGERGDLGPSRRTGIVDSRDFLAGKAEEPSVGAPRLARPTVAPVISRTWRRVDPDLIPVCSSESDNNH